MFWIIDFSTRKVQINWGKSNELCSLNFELFIVLLPLFSNRELSSVGSEHLPYKQRVTGSNPVAPTNDDEGFKRFVSETIFSFAEGVLLNVSRVNEHTLITAFTSSYLFIRKMLSCRQSFPF
jgi:hypothetical protein